MTLSTFKKHLHHAEELDFRLPGGKRVPAHFHITEAGVVSRHVIDCGGVVRSEASATLQIWYSEDTGHRLTPQKLLGILSRAGEILVRDDLELEFEYQTDTTGRYGVAFGEGRFELIPKHTGCLAGDSCIEPSRPSTVRVTAPVACCTPGGGCC